jgi:7-carboxy-7-deazaguanine synthase
MLRVKEVFATVQGEGSNAGRSAVFVRLVGCNLWFGLQGGRATGKGVCAGWCDTDFVGGEAFEVDALIAKVTATNRSREVRPLVVITGGEPTLQLAKPDGERFVLRLLVEGFDVAIETNGTVAARVLSLPGVHVCVSPKALRDAPGLDHVVVRTGTEIKIVAPQWTEADVEAMSAWGFRYRYVQPLDVGGGALGNVAEALALAGRHGWRVGLQTHKLLGVP